MSKRFVHLARAIEATARNSKASKPYRILEVGVRAGDNARRMIDHAFKSGRQRVEFYGFGLFKGADPAVSLGRVEKYLRDHTRGSIKLYKGESRDTLPTHAGKIGPVDVILFSGSHDLTSVAFDWINVQKLIHAKTVVLFDNYHPGDYTRGSAHLVDFLTHQPGFDVQLRDPVDEPPVVRYPTRLAWVRPTEFPFPPRAAYVLPETADVVITDDNVGTLTVKAVEEVRALPSMAEVLLANPMRAALLEEEDSKFNEAVRRALEGPAAEVPASEPFPTDVGGDRPDVHEAGVREDSGSVGAAEPAEQVPGDGGGRREPGLGEDDLGRVPEGPAAPAPLPEERPEPDPVVELGPDAGAGDGDPVRGGGELGREVPAPVAHGGGSRSRRRNRGSGGPNDQRPGTPPQATSD